MKALFGWLVSARKTVLKHSLTSDWQMCISWELHTSSTGSITLMNLCCFLMVHVIVFSTFKILSILCSDPFKSHFYTEFNGKQRYFFLCTPARCSGIAQHFIQKRRSYKIKLMNVIRYRFCLGIVFQNHILPY